MLYGYASSYTGKCKRDGEFLLFRKHAHFDTYASRQLAQCRGGVGLSRLFVFCFLRRTFFAWKQIATCLYVCVCSVLPVIDAHGLTRNVGKLGNVRRCRCYHKISKREAQWCGVAGSNRILGRLSKKKFHGWLVCFFLIDQSLLNRETFRAKRKWRCWLALHASGVSQDLQKYAMLCIACTRFCEVTANGNYNGITRNWEHSADGLEAFKLDISIFLIFQSGSPITLNKKTSQRPAHTLQNLRWFFFKETPLV